MGKQAAKPSLAEIQEIQDAVFHTVEPLIPSEFFLLAADFEKEAGQWFLRIYLEGNGFRISLSDCEAISRLIEGPLELLACLTPYSYSLEISSPGAFRELKTAREFHFFKGHSIALQLPDNNPSGKRKAGPANTTGNQEKISGILADYDAETHTLLFQSMKKSGEAPEIQRIPLKETPYRVCLEPSLPDALTLSPEMV